MFTRGRVEPGAIRVGGFAALAVAVVVFGAVMVKEAARGQGYDLVPLVVAGRLVETGKAAHLYAQDPHAYNLVDDPAFNDAAREAGFKGQSTPFVYPPLIAWLMTLISGASFATIARAWAGISVGLILAGMYFTRAIYVPESSIFALAASLVALCVFEPILYGFWLSQTTALIFPMVMGAILLERRGRPHAAGALLALATFIKITPGIFVLIWFWSGPRRATVAFVVALGALWSASVFVMGFDPHVEYLRRVIGASGALLVAFNNHSLLPFFARFAFDEATWLDWRFRTPPTTVVVLHRLTILSMLAVAGSVLWRTARHAPDRARMMAEGVAFLMILLVPNIAWTHYFVFLLPVMAIIVRLRSQGALFPIVAVATAFVLCCRPLLAAQNMWPSFSAGPLGVGVPTMVALLLFETLLLVSSRAWVVGPRLAAQLGVSMKVEVR